MQNKRGISAIVATVMIILITVAAIGILWAAIIPMIQTSLDFSSLQGRVNVLEKGYTAYDSANKIASVQVKRDVDEGVMDRIKITFEVGGNSHSSSVVAPPSGGTRVYTFDMSVIGEPDSVSVAPIFAVGNKEKEGESTSTVDIPKSRISGSTGAVYEIGREYFGDGSCLEILNFGDNIGSAIYTIDPDGKEGEDPFDVYCDMTTQGGGWTKIEYVSDLEHISQFSGGDARRWLASDFSLVLSKNQIEAIQAISSEGKQRYVGSCDGVLSYYHTNELTYVHAFGFRFLDGSESAYGQKDYTGTDISVSKDECAANGGANLETIFEIRDVRVPIINVYSRDNGNAGEKFGSPLTQNPAWLR